MTTVHKVLIEYNTLYGQLLGHLALVRKALSFTHELSFLYFFIIPPCSAAAQWMTIKCIPEVQLYVKLQQLV